jgi:hypothetical protein
VNLYTVSVLLVSLVANARLQSRGWRAQRLRPVWTPEHQLAGAGTHLRSDSEEEVDWRSGSPIGREMSSHGTRNFRSRIASWSPKIVTVGHYEGSFAM